MSRALVLALTLLAPGLALAQSADEPAPPNARYQQKTEIDFDALKLTGEVVDDGIDLVIERRHGDFNPLIALRRDFNDQMAGSVDEVR